MRMNCPGCKTVYNLPKELFPERKRITFRCEKCGDQIEFDLPLEKGKSLFPSPDQDKPLQPEKGVAAPPTAHDITEVQALKSKIRMTLMGFLPPMAQVITKAQMVMANPYAGLRDLAEVIETDQSIATRTLEAANSAYYSLAGKVTSISHASVLLGNKILGEIIMMTGTRGFLGERLKGYGLDSGVLWRHSLAVAVGSKIIAAKKDPELAEDAFVAGLIHDVGMIMLDQHIFEKREAFDEIARDGSHSFLQAERAVLGTDHPEVGSEIFQEWGIPRALLKPMANHRRPSSSGGQLVYVVHLADMMARRSGYGTEIDDALYEVDDGAMEFLDLQEEDLAMVVAETGKSVERITNEMLEIPP